MTTGEPDFAETPPPRRTRVTYLSEDIRISIGMDMKVNLGAYESASVSLYLSGVHIDAEPADIEAALDTAKITFDQMRDRLREKVKIVRATGREWRDDGE